MISQSFTMAGVSESWLRKMLPDSLKFTKHKRKDYLERKQQRDQQPIMQQQQQQQQQHELAELPASRQPILEQQQQLQQPSDEKATKVTVFDNKLAERPLHTHKDGEEKLNQRIEELQMENFRDVRDPDPCSRRVFSFHKPETLCEWISQSDTRVCVRQRALGEVMSDAPDVM
jgi:hypothetical protein